MAGHHRPNRASLCSDQSASSQGPPPPAHSQAYLKQSSNDTPGVSKFVEAMRNPNWRDRRTFGSEISAYDDPSLENREHAAGCASGDQGSNETWAPQKTSPFDFIAAGRNWEIIGDSFEEDNSALDVSAASPEQPTIRYSDKMGFCDIVRQIDFSGLVADDKPLNIIELAPCDSSHGFSGEQRRKRAYTREGLFEIRRVLDVQQPASRKPSGNQDEQYIAALNESKGTPEKFKSPLSSLLQDSEPYDNPCRPSRHLVSMSASRHPSQAEAGIRRARMAVLEDPAVASVRSYRIDHGGARISRHKENHEWSSRTAKEKPNHTSNDRDMAFQMMLQKLYNSSQQKKSESPLPLSDAKANNGISAKQNSCDFQNRAPFPILPPPQRSRTGARADSAIGSMSSNSLPSRNGNDTPLAEAILAAKKPDNIRSLNPKAREFLSFAGGLPSTGMKNNPTSRLDSFKRFSEGEKSSPSPDEMPMKRISASQPPHTELEASLAHFLHHNSLAGATYSNAAANSCGDHILGTSEPSPPDPYFHGSFPRPLVMLPPAVSPFQLLAPPGLGQLKGSSPTAPMVSAAFCSPPTNIIVPPLVGPSSQGAYLGSGNIGCPVRKPRAPDPANQQAYEAWIEWRKANEPGYAVECKLRQQRRIDKNRNLGNKSRHSSQNSQAVMANA